MTVITNPTPVISLEAAREALANVAQDNERKTGEVIADYAGAMCRDFNLLGNDGSVTTPWFDLKGKLYAPVKAERAKFVAAFEARNLAKGTVDVYWQRVKAASGKTYTKNRVSGSGDPEALCLDNLKTMINRIFKMEEDGVETDWSDEKAVLMDVYGRMGGDVDSLG